MILKKLFENTHETKSIDIVKFIQDNCKPFLQENPSLHPLYRGMKKRMKTSFQVEDVRKDRKPLNTTNDLQNIIDNAFDEIGIIAKRRNSVFVTKSKYKASFYGSVFNMIPIGDFDYTYSNDYDDMYSYIGKIIDQLPIRIVDKSIFDNSDLSYDIFQTHYSKAFILRIISKRMFGDSLQIFNKPELIEVDWSKLPVLLKDKYKTTSFGDIKENTEIMIACDKILILETDVYDWAREKILQQGSK